MKLETFSHRSAASVLPEKKILTVSNVLSAVTIVIEKGKSTEIRKTIMSDLERSGWSGKTKVSLGSNISVTSMNDEVALCLQTGNMSRFYADILKLQVLFSRSIVKGGVVITPSQAAAKLLGSNIANFRRLTRELR